jgi:WD40 repeat protein
MFDCLSVADIHQYREPANPDYPYVGAPEDREETFLVLGMNKGMVLFVKMNNLDHIYTRVSIHRQCVTNIVENREHGVFFSMSAELDLKIWGFDDKAAAVYQDFSVYRQVFDIVRGKANQLLMCFAQGDSELLLWDNEKKQLMELAVDKQDEHEDLITCADTLPELGLFVTGDREGLVKIWNSLKELVREIKFVEPVFSVVFLNKEADIIVSHQGNISKLLARDYMDKRMVVTDEMHKAFLAKAKPVDEKWFKKLSTASKHAKEACGHAEYLKMPYDAAGSHS